MGEVAAGRGMLGTNNRETKGKCQVVMHRDRKRTERCRQAFPRLRSGLPFGRRACVCCP